ncbi:hypothetical protein HY485_03995 [Candidatus Woesearchaeota archaeon]|nr:hypothetical protein [Candidatus Woesearchaeota archaeon]
MSKKTNYDDWALVMAAIISCIAILGLTLFLKSGFTGNYIANNANQILEISQPVYQGSPAFYCNEEAFALWTRQTVDAILRIGYSCTVSDVNKDVTCCWPPKE